MAGGFAGNRLGAVRDAKGKSKPVSARHHHLLLLSSLTLCVSYTATIASKADYLLARFSFFLSVPFRPSFLFSGVGEVFVTLSSSQKAEILRALAAKVFSTIGQNSI
jgi:hypothetical protein